MVTGLPVCSRKGLLVDERAVGIASEEIVGKDVFEPMLVAGLHRADVVVVELP